MLNDVKNVVHSHLKQVHTNTIGKVVKVNEHTVDVDVVFGDTRYRDKLPTIPNVPIANLQGGANYENYPVSVGDYCLLVVIENAIDFWYNGIDGKQPIERRFDLSDVIAIVGINPIGSEKPIPEQITQIGNKYIEGDYTHIGDINLTGNLHVVGNITATGDITAGVGSRNVSLLNHTHTQGAGDHFGAGGETNIPS